MIESMRPDWSGLVDDLLKQIAICLVTMKDFKAFRGVCSDWRAAAPEDKYLNGGYKIPMLLLPEKKNGGERELYSLWDRKIRTVKFPENATGERWLDVGYGWILTMSPGDFKVFKPLSREEPIQVNIELVFEKCEIRFIKQAWLSNDPSLASNEFGIFNVEDRSLEMLHFGSSHRHCSPPLWISI